MEELLRHRRARALRSRREYHQRSAANGSPAGRARNPRIADRLLRRVRDFAIVDGDPVVTRRRQTMPLRLLDVDAIGLDQMDRRYLEMVAQNLAAVQASRRSPPLSEPRDAIEDIIEPYLLQQGFLQRTPRGRPLTAQAFRHLGLVAVGPAAQFGLFGEEDS